MLYCFIEGLLISNKSYKMKQLQFVMKMKLKYGDQNNCIDKIN